MGLACSYLRGNLKGIESSSGVNLCVRTQHKLAPARVQIERLGTGGVRTEYRDDRWKTLAASLNRQLVQSQRTMFVMQGCVDDGDGGVRAKARKNSALVMIDSAIKS